MERSSIENKIIISSLLFSILLLMTTNVHGTNYYQLKINLEGKEIKNSTISLQKIQGKVPNLKQTGPYEVEIIGENGKIIGTKKFDIKESMVIEKRLQNGTWINMRVEGERNALINFEYNPSIDSVKVKKNDKKLIEIPVKKKINFSLKICKDRACKKESNNYAVGESFWINYTSDKNNFNISTFITYPNNSTEKINIPKKMNLTGKGEYEIKSTVNKMGYERSVETKRIKIEDNMKIVGWLIPIMVVIIIIISLLFLFKRDTFK
ncbi:MAG: hypothetical protein ABEK17_00490 [Candidatus Aenigmatarchaeota archaeon]